MLHVKSKPEFISVTEPTVGLSKLLKITKTYETSYKRNKKVYPIMARIFIKK